MKNKLILTILVSAILMVSSGCVEEEPKTIFIKEWSTDPPNIQEGQVFTLYTTIENPTPNADETYISYDFDPNCISFRDYNVQRNEKIQSGSIKTKSILKVSTNFRVTQNRAGQTCSISIKLYPSEVSTTSIDTDTAVIPIVREID